MSRLWEIPIMILCIATIFQQATIVRQGDTIELQSQSIRENTEALNRLTAESLDTAAEIKELEDALQERFDACIALLDIQEAKLTNALAACGNTPADEVRDGPGWVVIPVYEDHFGVITEPSYNINCGYEASDKPAPAHVVCGTSPERSE